MLQIAVGIEVVTRFCALDAGSRVSDRRADAIDRRCQGVVAALDVSAAVVADATSEAGESPPASVANTR